MATLPTDIITDILSRLPSKSLCRFICVGKSWNSLINDPSFITLHHNFSLNSKNPNLIICHDSLSISEIPANNHHTLRFSDLDHPVNHLPDYATVQFLGSCNGILCISDRYKKTLFLYNPCTKTQRLIPPVPSSIPDDNDPLLTNYNPLVYKQVDHITVFGFGFDSGSDDYKLLRVVERYEERVQMGREVRLYSLKNNSWKRVSDELIYYPNQPFDGIHVNGVLYFLVTNEGGTAMVKCFDLKTEIFSVLAMFDYDRDCDNHNFVFCDLKGCFGVMANYLKHDYNMPYGWKLGRADLWVRKEIGKKECWVRLFSISDPVRIRNVSNIRPVVYSKDGGRILLEFSGSMFFWYDWVSNKFESVEATGLPHEEPFDTYAFVGSLVSLATDKKKTTVKTVPKKNTHKKNSGGFLSTGFKLRL
ncbi:F-box protein CPR1-like [Silene latifolia]|uniref:F-box protein CPR1-like n=1 Tax=Silene latifolia TaxID=37657 RepID=UPI003D77DF11